MAGGFDDLILRATPRSTPQARALISNDKIKTLTKLKLQEYISSFFGKLGENRDLLTIVSPRSLTYNIDKSFDPKTDTTERKMQVARYFNELRNVIPAILIVDSGINPVMHNIGLISDAYHKEGHWNGHYPILRKIPISVIAATRDQESADELSSVLSLLFNELRNLAGGNYMQGVPEQGETWSITLPNEGVSTSAVNEVDVEGDPIEKIHYCELSFEVMFEDVVRVRQELPTFQPRVPVANVANLANQMKPVIECPDVVNVNEQITVYVKNITNAMRIVVSDARIATLSYNMVLTPRKVGNVKIQVIDPTRSPAERVVSEKAIQIL